MDFKKVFFVGCGTVLAFFLILFIVFVVWIATMPEGGVRLPNEMEEYAVQYLDDHDILVDSEELLAYYDVTLSMDGSEAAIVTTDRVIYHKNGQNDSIALAEIADVRHRNEGIIGDVFEIASESGRTIKIEIAPLNQGETFKNVLFGAWNRAKGQEPNME